jgi:DNA repair protein RadA/Sms
VPGRRTVFVCRECGHSTPKWAGRCSDCGAWDSLLESETPKRSRDGVIASELEPVALGDVRSVDYPRIRFGLQEVERVFGGGLVPGSLCLLGGDPGIGKSTLMIQIANGLPAGETVLYVSGEESPHQLRLRADRLGIDGTNISVLPEVAIDHVLSAAEKARPSMLIVDSIQTARVDDLESVPGSIAQVRETANRLLRYAKESSVPVLIAGHVTKDGNVAGPRTLEHLVDAVMYLEGEPHSAHRLLRTVKNRFGSTNEVAVLAMRGDGLAEVANPSSVFLSERNVSAPGSAVAVSIEGSRAIMVEVQALVSRTVFSLPKRLATGYDSNRLTMMVAVLGKRAGTGLYDQDVYVNVVGGLRLSEPAVDLPVALAIASSLRGRPVKADVAAFGEVGLVGEVRSVSQGDRRLEEAGRMNFDKCLIPKSLAGVSTNGAVAVSDLNEAFEVGLD